MRETLSSFSSFYVIVVTHKYSFFFLFINFMVNRVKWIDRSNGKVGVKVVLIDGQRGEGQALRAIQSHYRTSIEDMPVSTFASLLYCNMRDMGHEVLFC